MQGQPEDVVQGGAATPGQDTDGGPSDTVEVKTFDWLGGRELLRTTQFLVEVEPEEPPARRLEAGAGWARRATAMGTGQLLDALWDRPKWRDARFNLTATTGEHPCFAGFASMMRDTDRCRGFVRRYPAVGGTVTFLNTGVGLEREFTLRAVVAEHINVWLEKGTSELHAEVSKKAARIYSNDFDIDELRPAPGSRSWMEHECKVMGSLPFHYTCSNRINILVQQCNMANAWVRQSDYLRNFPEPANSEPPPNHDIVFYMCRELIDSNPNPYAAANTFAHELAHVIQGGFGFSFNAMTEGGATWLEGPLLGLPPRPMVYAWGFRDWNRINAAHFYANTKGLNARKFYQIHAMFLTYLSQDELLGDAATSALQNYQTFESTHVPWGRMAYDYFLGSLGRGRPADFATVSIDAEDAHNAFADALLDFRVALAAQCIAEASRRPSEPRYLMPPELRDRPFWDCSSYPTFWSAARSSVRNASMDICYGGAAVYRLVAPRGATVSVAADADPLVRTKVLAAGEGPDGAPAEVRELGRGDSVTFTGGARELFVVQVNVDPEGEMLSSQIWRKSAYKCEGLCQGRAWTTAAGGGRLYPPSTSSALRSPLLQLPEAEEATLSFAAMWDMEALSVDGSVAVPGCPAKGYDGVQVRVHVYDRSDAQRIPREDGDMVAVLRPASGYGRGLGNETGLHVFARSGLHPKNASCEFYEGWAGRSTAAGGVMAFLHQSFSLAPYAGKRVSVELVFASDGSVAGEGFWVDGIEVRAGSGVLLSDDAEGDGEGGMFEHALLAAPIAGTVGPHDGVPVVAQLPQNWQPDRGLEKALDTRRAPWSAAWEAVPRWVALKGHHGTYLVAEPSGMVLANRDELGDWEKFQLFHNQDGTVSLKSFHGKYLAAVEGGTLIADRCDLDEWEKFQLLRNDGGSVSLKSSHGKYVAAEASGGASANREELDDWEMFDLVYMAPEGADEASLRRAHLGWSYSAPTQSTQTALLHPWQEACVQLQAPFRGRLRQATLFTLVDKSGISAVLLAARAAAAPYGVLGGGALTSPSPAVADPGIHRFGLLEAWPLFEEAEPFLLCVGVGGVRRLPADDPDREPFLHLPLTNVTTAGLAGQPGATFLLVTQEHGGLEVGSTSGLDPWAGHSLTLRAEFVEQAAAVAAPTAAAGPAAGLPAARREPAFWP